MDLRRFWLGTQVRVVFSFVTDPGTTSLSPVHSTA